MTFDATAGKIRITNALGVKTLDTEEDDLFHVISTKSGLINIPQVALGGGNTINDTQIFDLGAVHPACTHVVGAARFDGSVGGAVGFDHWTTYMGGDLIWVFSGFPKDANGVWSRSPSDYVGYRFDISAGRMWMVQRRIILGGFGTAVYYVRAHSIQYALDAGAFT